MSQRASWSYLFLLLAVDAFGLVRFVPDVERLARDLTAPGTWVAQSGPDRAASTLAAAALWCVGVWLAVGIVATVMGGLPGVPGRLATTVSTALLPGAIRRVVASAAGIGVMLAPIAAHARTAKPAPLPATLPAPAWPLSVSPSGSEAEFVGNSATSSSTAVRVNTGDSLWEIAADRLGPRASPADVARAWRRIYARNRHLIGQDPGSIKPGQTLQVPIDPEELR
ncbi:MAG: LysM peptidoglycan-binding domain-containing protein [Actinomycetota bacterium]|nr:LysM peptidoglycan-binding domain-containing protein [Actinomycetota bacterium]